MRKQVRDNLIKAGLVIAGIFVVCKRLPPGTIDSMIDSLNQALSESSSITNTYIPNPIIIPPPQPSGSKPLATLPNPSLYGTQTPLTTPPVLSTIDLPVDHDLTEIIPHPSVVLILGKRGSGKSALAYRVLELLRYKAIPYVIGFPKEGKKLLPDWIGIAQDLEEVPHDSVVLIDEAYISYHARGSANASSKAMSQLINLSRQRNQTLVFVSQEARQIDKNIASSASIIVFKEPAMLQLEFDRAELNKLARQAKAQFDNISGDKRKWSYIYSPDADFLGLQQCLLPSFWKPSLSRIFAMGIPLSITKHLKKMTKEERVERAKELFNNGWSYDRIAKSLNVTKGTAWNYVKGYPYKK